MSKEFKGASPFNWMELFLKCATVLVTAGSLSLAWVQYQDAKREAERAEQVTQQNQELEEQLTSANEATEDAQSKAQETAQQLEDLRDNPNTITVSEETSEFIRRLARGNETPETVVARSVEFYADPPEGRESPVNNDCSNLEIGDPCYKNGVKAIVSNVRPSTCKDGIFEFDLKFINVTEGTKNTKINGSNLSVLVDNIKQPSVWWASNERPRTRCDRAIPAYNSLTFSNRELVSAPFELDRIASSEQQNYYYIVYGNLGTQNEEIAVQINSSDPIDGATWKINISDL